MWPCMGQGAGPGSREENVSLVPLWPLPKSLFRSLSGGGAGLCEGPGLREWGAAEGSPIRAQEGPSLLTAPQGDPRVQFGQGLAQPGGRRGPSAESPSPQRVWSAPPHQCHCPPQRVGLLEGGPGMPCEYQAPGLSAWAPGVNTLQQAQESPHLWSRLSASPLLQPATRTAEQRQESGNLGSLLAPSQIHCVSLAKEVPLSVPYISGRSVSSGPGSLPASH